MSAAIAYLDTLQGSGIRPGLGRMRAVLRALGRPDQAIPSVIVAGTNGKGSTSATLASILRCSGYRTGLYTSPHLVDIRERWLIDGRMIDPAALDRAVERLRNASDRSGITPTYFEALTLVAFIAFHLDGCEVTVLEVGMGGRLDATNVVRPIAALISPVGIDHTEYLGSTIRKIASEKAGVIHRGAAVLTSNDDPAVVNIVRRRAERLGSVLHDILAEIRVELVRDREPSGQRFRLATAQSTYELATPLTGAFQQQNVALAVRGAEELRERFPKITTEAIVQGVAETRWRGRLERVDRAGKDIWIDGAHNPHAVRRIVEFLARHTAKPRLLVFGIMGDKDVHAVTSALFPLFQEVITTEPYPPRSADAEKLAAIAREMRIHASAEPDPRRAIERALRSSQRTVLIAGSLYLAGAAIEVFDRTSS